MSYEKKEIYEEGTTAEIAAHVKEILRLLGEDPDREGLVKTPERVAKALQFLTQGYSQDGTRIIQSAIFDEEYRQMVLVKDIELYSTCEHHMMPFLGKCHVAYIPNGKITGQHQYPGRVGDPCHLRDHEHGNFARRYPRLAGAQDRQALPEVRRSERLGARNQPRNRG